MKISLLAALGLFACVVGPQSVSGAEATMTQIYMGFDWYQERPEPEREWRGVMRERHVSTGPAGRPALAFELITSDEGTLPTYAAGVVPKLAPFVGRQVLVRGKRVDLTGEGYGPELWIGSLSAMQP